MRLSLLSVCIAVLAAAAIVGAARAMHARPDTARIRAYRASVDHYRSVAWLFQRAAHQRRTPTSYSYRRSTDPSYLQWTLKEWQKREYAARLRAADSLRHRLGLQLPAAPGLHASLPRRIADARGLVAQLTKVDPRQAPARSLESARLPATKRLFRWQVKAAVMTLHVSRHATRLSAIATPWLTDAFTCIHRYEGAWNSNTGNGYYGGLQMDEGFMSRYGAAYERQWGTADRWPAWAQIDAAVRAYRSGRGFWPWPNTARACGLL